MAVDQPAIPAINKACQSERDRPPYQTQAKTSSPAVATPPPNPARSWAMSGMSRGLKERKRARQPQADRGERDQGPPVINHHRQKSTRFSRHRSRRAITLAQPLDSWHSENLTPGMLAKSP
jgi:hypothetical protein